MSFELSRKFRLTYRISAGLAIASFFAAHVAGAQPIPTGPAPAASSSADAAAPPPVVAPSVAPPAPVPVPVPVLASEDPKTASSSANAPRLHIESSSTVNIEKRAAGTTAWAPYCTSPCDVASDTAAQYRVTGTDISPSSAFYLQPPAAADRIEVRVTPGKPSNATVGYVLLGSAGALAIGGAVALILGNTSAQRNEQTNPDDGTTHNSHTNATYAGTLLILAGVATGITGGAMVVDSSETRVTGAVRMVDEGAPHDARRVPASATRSAARADSRPASVDIPLRDVGSPPARTVSIPIWGGTF